jgi:asparagine synthase (glutamine-hydrolysing)
MCGITGVIGKKLENKEQIISKMTDKIEHRGPDDQGFYVDKNVGLGMRRLSIIDLSSGKQPITSENGELLIFFNGEIYNYKELKQDLEKKYKFKTDSDTEVILHMYEEYAEKMLPLLRGMFAFAIYNTKSKDLFVARDFFGIKPLYYLTQEQDIIAFSSEIKSFLDIPGFKVEVNDNAVYNYLSFQYNPLPETFFKNVYKLPPAHYLKINCDSGEAEIRKYWSFDFKPDTELDEESTKKKIKEVIKDSVAHHMIADVPVGSFLSGGIDSSIIATLMQEVRGDKKIKTFTVGFDNLSEGENAKETSSFLGTDHTEINIGPTEYFNALEKIVYHFDEPVADPSAVGLYFIAQEARKTVKVVLSGEGSDEFFGGYNIYLAPLAAKKLAWLPKSVLNYFTNLNFEYYGKNYLKRVEQKLEDWYIGNASVFKKDDLSKLWTSSEEKSISLIPLYKNISNLSDSTKMQYIDINTWLVGDILAKADKMTMANSLELRVPFLDIEVSKLASTLPDSFKWRSGVTKYLLREAFNNVIPEGTRNRKKLGFPVPLKDWLLLEHDFVYKKITENAYIKRHMSFDYIDKLIESHTKKEADNTRKIYALLMLALWYDTFVKQK